MRPSSPGLRRGSPPNSEAHTNLVEQYLFPVLRKHAETKGLRPANPVSRAIRDLGALCGAAYVADGSSKRILLADTMSATRIRVVAGYVAKKTTRSPVFAKDPPDDCQSGATKSRPQNRIEQRVSLVLKLLLTISHCGLFLFGAWARRRGVGGSAHRSIECSRPSWALPGERARVRAAGTGRLARLRAAWRGE